MSVAGVSSNNTYNSGGMSYAATAKTDKKKKLFTILCRKKHNHYAKYDKDNTSCAVECLWSGFICKYSGNSCPYKCKYNT